ncbi:MAG: hypothetical protein M1837_003396 [Sclerophora amabilis]|nr:MAG: hypothetical protein M1837_003396 [Sclerophora amabilis]
MEYQSSASTSDEQLAAPGNTTIAAAAAAAAESEPGKIKRQPLSCLKCRQRKVKCDRVKPCQACCVRGQPRDCDFAVAENDDYGPINQAHEIRRLRTENAKLRTANLKYKERSEMGTRRALARGGDDNNNNYNNSDGSSSSDRKDAPRIPKKPARFQQKRFKTLEASDNLYFGSPGLANVIADFANVQIGSGPASSVTHAAPRGVDIFAFHDVPLYPFPSLWRADGGAAALLDCLPPREELFGYLDAFQKRAQSCSFPHVPEEITTKEIERFLSDPKGNSFKYPDMLALIFAALAQGLQNGVFDKSGGEWVEGAMEAESWKGDLYLAAAMQALRIGSFMNRPTLLGLQTLIMIGPYLTNAGKFLDAWALFGVTIRLAQSVGLHRSPQYLDPTPPLRECSVRQALWWWMLHMDQQYSMTLGRPLGISGIGDCPPPEPLTTNPTILRVSEYINSFTILARQILSSDRLTTNKIDDFTDRLLALRDTLPDIVQFDETWLDLNKPLPDWPLDAMAAVFEGKTHNYLILLNRQRQEIEATQDGARDPGSDREKGASSGSSHSTTATAPPRGRDRVLASARALLQAFEYFHSRVRAAMICWTMGQQAFNASMILTLSLLDRSPSSKPASQDSIRADYLLVHRAFATFTEMHQKGIHKLAGLACAKLSTLLLQLGPLPPQSSPDDGAGAVAGMAGDATTSNQNYGRPSAPGKPNEDTVMGNTGMLLLEDPGLQGFVQEGFAPLNFQMAGSDLPPTGMGWPRADVDVGSGPDLGMPMGMGWGVGAGMGSPAWAARGAPRDMRMMSDGLGGLGHPAPPEPSSVPGGGSGSNGSAAAGIGLEGTAGGSRPFAAQTQSQGPDVGRRPEVLNSGLAATTFVSNA